MYHAVRVQVLDAVEYLVHKMDCILFRKLTAFDDTIKKLPSSSELFDEMNSFVVFANLKQLNAAWMVDSLRREHLVTSHTVSGGSWKEKLLRYLVALSLRHSQRGMLHLHHRNFMLDSLRIELRVAAHQRLDCNFDVGLALSVPKAADCEGAPVSNTDCDDRYPRAKHAAYKHKYRECTHSPSASPTLYPCRFTMEGSESLAVGVTNRRAHVGVRRRKRPPRANE